MPTSNNQADLNKYIIYIYNMIAKVKSLLKECKRREWYWQNQLKTLRQYGGMKIREERLWFECSLGHAVSFLFFNLDFWLFTSFGTHFAVHLPFWLTLPILFNYQFKMDNISLETNNFWKVSDEVISKIESDNYLIRKTIFFLGKQIYILWFFIIQSKQSTFLILKTILLLPKGKESICMVLMNINRIL